VAESSGIEAEDKTYSTGGEYFRKEGGRIGKDRGLVIFDK